MYDQYCVFFVLSLILLWVGYEVSKVMYKSVLYVIGYRVVHVSHLKALEKTINKLESTLNSRQYTIEYLMSNPIKKERSGQLTFASGVSNNVNGAKINLTWRVPDGRGNLDVYNLLFKNMLDRMRFTSEDYVWVERHLRNVGKRGNKYDYRWVHIDELLPDDIELLVNFPHVPNNNKDYLDDKFLPFKWEKEKTKQLELRSY